MTESSKQHSHSHAPSPPSDDISATKFAHRFKQAPHPHRTPDPSTRLARLFLFLEAQFGEEAVRPITLPRNSTTTATTNGTPAPTTDADTPSPDAPAPDTTNSPTEPFSAAANPPENGYSADDQLSNDDKLELKRLHHLGIPVPGVEIKFDKFVAKVWLEDLDVECSNNALRARVKAVVERGVETVSGLWS